MITVPNQAVKRPMLAAALIVLLLGVAVAVRNVPPTTPDNPAPIVVEENFEPRRMTLEGTLVCLPHVDTEGPQTDECALGLRTDDGTHYAITLSRMSSIPEEHRVGDRVTGSGVMTPIERLSTDHWRKYDVQGIFSVTDGFKVIK